MKADIKQSYNFADETGIWHVPVKQDGSMWLAPIRLCDYFAVDGVGRQVMLEAGQHDENQSLPALKVNQR